MINEITLTPEALARRELVERRVGDPLQIDDMTDGTLVTVRWVEKVDDET